MILKVPPTPESPAQVAPYAVAPGPPLRLCPCRNPKPEPNTGVQDHPYREAHRRSSMEASWFVGEEMLSQDVPARPSRLGAAVWTSQVRGSSRMVVPREIVATSNMQLPLGENISVSGVPTD